MHTPSTLAREAARYLERGWTRHEPAVDANGKECRSWGGPPAVAWSILGAVQAAFWDDHSADQAKLQLVGRLRILARIDCRCNSLIELNQRFETAEQAAAFVKTAIQDGASQ